MVKIEKIESLLAESNMKLQFIYQDILDSTNTMAKQLIRLGADEGTVVIAGCQTLGRGRYDREWCSPEGGLYLTLIIRPKVDVVDFPLYNLLTACAVSVSVRELYDLDVTLKWPNDVLLDSDKISGILSEVVQNPAGELRIIIGVGINVNTRISDYPVIIQDQLTTICFELGADLSLEQLVAHLIVQIFNRLKVVEESNSFKSILTEWRELTSTLGRKITIQEDMEEIMGVATDIDDQGALIVELDTGETRIVSVGDVFYLE